MRQHSAHYTQLVYAFRRSHMFAKSWWAADDDEGGGRQQSIFHYCLQTVRYGESLCAIPSGERRFRNEYIYRDQRACAQSQPAESLRAIISI